MLIRTHRSLGRCIRASEQFDSDADIPADAEGLTLDYVVANESQTGVEPVARFDPGM